MASGIYKITNLINRKMYIGSAVNINNRFAGHLCKLRKKSHANKHLQFAYNKYGEEALKFEVIEIVKNKVNLIEREQYWIDYFDTFNYGYNQLSKAGSSLGKIVSEKTKEKLRIVMLGNNHALGRKASNEEKAARSAFLKQRFNNPEFKKKLSERMKGNTNTLGYKHSEETKLKMSLARKGVSKPPESKENYKKAALLREAKKREGAPEYVEPIWMKNWSNKNAC